MHWNNLAFKVHLENEQCTDLQAMPWGENVIALHCNISLTVPARAFLVQ